MGLGGARGSLKNTQVAHVGSQAKKKTGRTKGARECWCPFRPYRVSSDPVGDRIEKHAAIKQAGPTTAQHASMLDFKKQS